MVPVQFIVQCHLALAMMWILTFFLIMNFIKGMFLIDNMYKKALKKRLGSRKENEVVGFFVFSQ